MKLEFWFFLKVIRANWLHQCTECVDQSLFSDSSLKTDIVSANITLLYEQMKQIKVRQFEHVDKEFFNRFFSRTNQLGVIAQELQQVCPSAVSLIPERRSASTNGTSVSTKNVLMVRESHVLFLVAGTVQELIARLERMGTDYWGRVGEWESVLTRLKTEMISIISDQSNISKNLNRMESQYFLLESSGEKIEKTVSVLAEKNAFIDGSLRLLTDQIAELINRVVVGEKRMYEEFQTERNLGTIARNELESEIFFWKSQLEKSVEQRRMLASRMVHIENEFFKLTSKGGDRFREILTRIQLEKIRLKIHGKSRKLALELADRRELFDSELINLREASDLRVLKSKLAGDLQIVEKKLAVEREKLKVELAVRVEESRMESEMKLRDKRENEDINLRELTIRNSAEQEKILLIIRETARVVVDTVVMIYSNPENILIGIASIILLIGGIFFAREFATLVREQVSEQLGKPSLIRYYSKKSFWSKKNSDSVFKDVVLRFDLFDRIRRLALATRTAKLRKSPLLHCLYYGPPGTGKTMVAKRFAEYSNLDYAIMCGGDVAPLGASGVTEIHNLFKWIHSSKRGVLLFIDEAESFLCARTAGMSENLRNAITAMLYHTGTSSSQFMLILATNRPSDLDAAIVDRMDESIEFGLPDFVERETLVRMYYDVSVSLPKSENFSEELSQVAKKLIGFSGREISKLFISLQTHLYSMGKEECDVETLQSVVNLKIAEHAKSREMKSNEYCFDESTLI